MLIFRQIISMFIMTGVAILIIILVTYIIQIFKKQKNDTGSKEIISNLQGKAFENFLQEHFRFQGFDASLTKETGDFGADLVLKKDGVITVVQVKRYKAKVGIEAVQQVIGAIKYYKADEGMVITTSWYTNNALKLAQANGITLWGRSKLYDFISKSDHPELVAKYSNQLQPIHKTKNLAGRDCPLCGNELLIINGKFGEFVGCSGFPLCSYRERN